MKNILILAGLLLPWLAFAQGATKIIPLAWEHDGQNLDGFLLVSLPLNAETPITPLASISPTNRTFTLTVVNPPARLRLAIMATNVWSSSGLSSNLLLEPPNVPGPLTTTTIVTVQSK